MPGLIPHPACRPITIDAQELGLELKLSPFKTSAAERRFRSQTRVFLVHFIFVLFRGMCRSDTVPRAVSMASDSALGL
jgi:hypothetical protein